MPSNTSDKARTILMIGASRGLGHAMAAEFLKKDWQVVGTVLGSERTPLHDLADVHPGGVEIESLDVSPRPGRVIFRRGRRSHHNNRGAQ